MILGNLLLLNKSDTLKKSILFILLIACGWASAQPNGGFENWTPEFNYEIPDNWQTLNFLSLASPPSDVSAFKAVGIDKHSGNYALKLKTVQVNSGQFPAELGDSIGGAFTGKINFSPFFYKFGYPYNGRPEKLEFWAKYTPVGNDTASAAVILRSWNGAVNDTIAMGLMAIPPSAVFTFYELTLDYIEDFLPDSAVIAFYPFKDTVNVRLGSTLYIDDVAFTGWVGLEESPEKQPLVSVFPNPAKNSITFCTTAKRDGNIQIRDISGKLLSSTMLTDDKTSVNTSLFPAGIYIYEISDSENNLLQRGRFSVTK